MDLALAILPHPERAFGPGEARIAAPAWRRDCAEYASALRVDLLDTIAGDLIQVLPVERRSCMSRDVERAHRIPGRRIEGDDFVSCGKPHLRAVVREPAHMV